MPNVFQWLKPFSKKKAHGGSKFHDYHHGYDNLRHSSYPTTPPSMMSHQHPYNTPAPPHSFSHRQHLYPQQLIMQSPPPQPQLQPMPPPTNQLNQPQLQFQAQVFTTTSTTTTAANNSSAATLANTNNHHQCQCNQCSLQQPQMQMQAVNLNTQHHQIHQNPPDQIVQQQHSLPAQSLSQAQMPITDGHMSIISPPPQPQQQQQQQQQQQHISQQLQPVQMPLVQQQQQQQQQHAHQQCQHIHQPQQVQQPLYQCQNSVVHNGYVNQSFIANTLAPMPQSPPQLLAQCTCQHCPYQQQQQQQQQFMQQLVPTNGTCQHQMTNTVAHNGSINLNGNQPIGQLQSDPHNHAMQQQQQQTCQSHMPQQTIPAIMAPTTPGPQTQQSTHSNTVNPTQQFQYHTIQPAQYQQQKQQMQHQQMQQQQQQQQHHHRVQSLHHQQTQPIQQHTHQSLQAASHLVQSQNQLTYQDHQQPAKLITQPQQCQLSSAGAHDYSRYANMQSLMDNTHGRTNCNQTSEYQEPMYYNQKPELPPYEPPPDYETFMEHRKMYSIDLDGQHMTHHSGSLVLQKAKDSSHENLRTKSSLYSKYSCG